MPFDPAPVPQEITTKPGRFQKYADAMLRGCQVTGPAAYQLIAGHGHRRRACALGAMVIGLGYRADNIEDVITVLHSDEVMRLGRAYYNEYGWHIERDNDKGHHTREEIAARIAALE